MIFLTFLIINIWFAKKKAYFNKKLNNGLGFIN